MSQQRSIGEQRTIQSITVGVAQSAAVTNDISSNAGTALRLLDHAAEMGVDLLVFPELFLCGYDLKAISRQPAQAAVAVDSLWIESLREKCAGRNISAVIGACVERPQGLANSAIAIDRAGRILDVYDKINLWTEEKKVFLPGSRLTLFDFSGLQVGVGICYDGGFPEHSRALAVKGADLIVYPSAFLEGEEKRRYHLYYPMRALENTLYVAVSNLVGEVDGGMFFGESAIFDPTGRLLGIGGSGEQIVVAEVNRERLEEVRAQLLYLKDLKSDFYSAAG